MLVFSDANQKHLDHESKAIHTNSNSKCTATTRPRASSPFSTGSCPTAAAAKASDTTASESVDASVSESAGSQFEFAVNVKASTSEKIVNFEIERG